jgi:hypothetical protein
MAKSLLLLQAGRDGAEALLAESDALCRQLHAQAPSAACTVRLLRPLADDPLYNGADGAHPAAVVVEIRTRPGLPLSAALDPLPRLLRACSALAPETSLALAMSERVFRPCAPQPLVYHYLMRRREDFSGADYIDYYGHYHSHFGMITPGIEGYRQNLVDPEHSRRLAGETGLGWREVTSVSEMELSTMDHFLNSAAIAEVGPQAALDESRFVDRAASVMFTSRVLLSLGNMATVGDSYFAG